MTGKVETLALCAEHQFSKQLVHKVDVVQGEGIVGDAHRGVTVKHRSRVAQNPDQPNLRQVHLLHRELLDDLALKGFDVNPGDLGENVLTSGIDLLGLPKGAVLAIGSQVRIEITGLRNPCAQIENFMPGLLNQVLDRDGQGNLVRKAGIMGIVLAAGEIVTGDRIAIHLPPKPHEKLERV